MPADANLIFTSGVFLSNLSDMRDGAPQRFTTPAVNIGSVGLALSPPMVARLFIPAFTNRSPGSGVGVYTRPIMTAVVQGAGGNPATEANWVDVASLYSQRGSTRAIRPHVALSSDGSGGTTNPIFSNVAVARFAGSPYTNYRISGQYLGSFPDFSAVFADLRMGHRNVDPELY